jgi:hypothetical protein
LLLIVGAAIVYGVYVIMEDGVDYIAKPRLL